MKVLTVLTLLKERGLSDNILIGTYVMLVIKYQNRNYIKLVFMTSAHLICIELTNLWHCTGVIFSPSSEILSFLTSFEKYVE